MVSTLVCVSAHLFFSLSTLHREYAALIGLQYYDFMDDILRPRLVRSVKVDEVDIKRAMATYAVNEPQAQAILGALQTDNFSLIQGVSSTSPFLQSRIHPDLLRYSLQEREKPRQYAVL